jgi:DNA-binding response OmpR family regulator
VPGRNFAATSRYNEVAARITVIDDDAPTRDFVTTALAGAGYDVQAADGGEEGVKLVERDHPT